MSRLRVAITVRRAALTGLAISALVAGVAATSAAVLGVVRTGVVADDAGGLVRAVSPTGFAWRQGIRPGQRVVSLVPAGDPGGWRLETTDGRTGFVAEAAVVEEGLRASLPIGLGALAAGGLAVLLVRSRRSWVLPASSLAILAGSTPIALQGDATLSTLVLAAGVLPPAGWILGRARTIWFQALALGSLLLLLVVWATSRLEGSDTYVALEDIRAAVAVWGGLGLLVDRTVLPIFRAEPLHMTRPQLFDVAYIAAAIAGAILLLSAFAAPLPLVGLALVIALVASPTVRRGFAPVENIVLSDIRAQAAAEGAEAERGRLARELHDAPLQELIGVIRRLELKPGTEAENDDLRALAGHLRGVAIDLRPPVLDDFGIPAAIEYLVEQTTSPELPVRTRLVDGTTLDRDARPPTDVELAVYRIASEAVTNARRHAAASEIWIEGNVGVDEVDITVRDDGKGFIRPRLSLPTAATRRQLGLASMRRRAQAIDAELDIDRSTSGTRVRVTWQR